MRELLERPRAPLPMRPRCDDALSRHRDGPVPSNTARSVDRLAWRLLDEPAY